MDGEMIRRALPPETEAAIGRGLTRMLADEMPSSQRWNASEARIWSCINVCGAAGCQSMQSEALRRRWWKRGKRQAMARKVAPSAMWVA